MFGRTRNRKTCKNKSHAFRLETLEKRELMAADISLTSTGVLDIDGTDANDLITIRPTTFEIAPRVQIAEQFRFVVPNRPAVALAMPSLSLRGIEVSVRDTQGNLRQDSQGNNLLRIFVHNEVKSIRVDAFDGADQVDNQTGISSVQYGGNGNDTLRGGSGGDYLFGGHGHDRMYGNSGNDYASGYAGDDYLFGSQGNDTLLGGDGRDSMYGDGGNDMMRGGTGNDSMYGHEGDDDLKGEAGNDTMSGGNGNDLITGESGNDRLSGDGGNDILWGGDEHDLIFAGAGNDEARGGAGNDTIFSGAGNDMLFGEWGNDSLHAIDGGDVLNGGSGTDLLRSDRPTTFQQGEDVRIDLIGGSPQDDNHSCGPNSAFRFLNAYGHNVTYNQLKQTVQNEPDIIYDIHLGSRPSVLHNVIRGFEAGAQLHGQSTFTNLVNTLKQGKPAVVLVKVGEEFGGTPLLHWVAASGVNEQTDRVYFTDTNGEAKTESFSDFQDRFEWSGGIAGPVLGLVGVHNRTFIA